MNRSQYDGTSVYEWNIDGYTEHQIMNIIQEMNIAINAYKSKGNSQSQIASLLFSGFTGTLKSWWDMYVAPGEKTLILTAKKIVIKHENNQQVQTEEEDILNTLIYSIVKNFIGDPTVFKEKSREILLNLTCRKLQDFRWYKDMFLTKVMLRPDCREPYWKERFIAGVPNLFAEKVRNKLREKYNNQIHYKELTYGELISYINKEGLTICSNLRLNDKLEKDKITGENELGDFCEQYGYEPLKAPSY